jgi:hypothetical protein
MALFGGKETKEEKAARKQQEMLKKYRLEELSDPEDLESVKRIVAELFGTDVFELDALLTGDVRNMTRNQMYYQRALVEQNFIIIRMLDRINKKLK